jgi:hypothetical protein
MRAFEPMAEDSQSRRTQPFVGHSYSADPPSMGPVKLTMSLS